MSDQKFVEPVDRDYCLLSERPKNFIPQSKLQDHLSSYGDKVLNEHKQAVSTLDIAVEQFKNKYPEKYGMAQVIGDDIMNKEYNLEIGHDVEGDRYKGRDLYNIYLDELITIDEFSPDEIAILDRVYKGWRERTCGLDDIILSNREEKEQLLRLERKKKLDMYVKARIEHEQALYEKFNNLTIAEGGWNNDGDYLENMKMMGIYVSMGMEKFEEDWRKNNE